MASSSFFFSRVIASSALFWSWIEVGYFLIDIRWVGLCYIWD